MINTKHALAAVLAASVAACGDSTQVESRQESVTSPTPGISARDNSIVTLGGIVTETRAGGFTMRHGAAPIRVEMDDWDAFPEAGMVRQGDAVVVRGVVDRDLWERRTIEASSVYLTSLDAYLYASSVDEEDFANLSPALGAVGAADEAVGYVTAIQGREFTLGTGDDMVRVDTARLENNPFDEQGSPPVQLGDRVLVHGRLELDPIERTELMAERLVRLVRPRPTNAGQSAGQPGGAAPSPGPGPRATGTSPAQTPAASPAPAG